MGQMIKLEDFLLCYMREWAGGDFLPTNMAEAIQMYRDFLNFGQP